jgi:hypothetical protein
VVTVSKVAGGRRNTKARSAKQVTKRARRLADPRVQSALAEAAAERARIDALVAAGEQSDSTGELKPAGRLAKTADSSAKDSEPAITGPVLLCGSTCGHDHDSLNGPTGCCAEHGPYLYFCDGCHNRGVDHSQSDMDSAEGARITVSEGKPTALPRDGDGKNDWTLGCARSMLRAGYTLRHVVTTTGWGARWFDDLPLVDGRGVSTEEWIASLPDTPRDLTWSGIPVS